MYVCSIQWYTLTIDIYDLQLEMHHKNMAKTLKCQKTCRKPKGTCTCPIFTTELSRSISMAWNSIRSHDMPFRSECKVSISLLYQFVNRRPAHIIAQYNVSTHIYGKSTVSWNFSFSKSNLCAYILPTPHILYLKFQILTIRSALS